MSTQFRVFLMLLMFTALVFGFLQYDEEQMFNPPDEERHRQAVSALGEATLNLFRWWQSQAAGEK